MRETKLTTGCAGGGKTRRRANGLAVGDAIAAVAKRVRVRRGSLFFPLRRVDFWREDVATAMHVPAVECGFAHMHVNGDDDEAQWVPVKGRQEMAVRTPSDDLSRRAPSSVFSAPGVLGT